MIYDISFETEKDRQKFEKRYNIKKKDILVDQNSNSEGFVAWQYLRNPLIDVVYFIGFEGYYDPHMLLRECLKGIELKYKGYKEYWTKPKKSKIIKIKFMAWIPINDRNAKWEKIRGRW